MNKYEKMKRNEEIKETLKKILHVVSYVLSVAFIVLMVIVGVQSCSNNKNNVVTENMPLNSHLRVKNAYINDIDLSEYYSYKLNVTTNSFFLGVADNKTIVDGYINLDTNYSSPQQTLSYNVNFDGYFVNLNNAEAVKLNYYTIYLKTYKVYESPVIYNYRISLVTYNVDGDNWWFFQYNGTESGSWDGNYHLITNINENPFRLLLNKDSMELGLFKQLYTFGGPTNFIFNKDFNFNAPLGLSIDNYYGGDVALAPITIAGGIYRYKYETGYFFSNNVIYNGIVIDYLNSGACNYVINNMLTLGQSDCLSYHALGFVRADNGLIDFVNYRNTSQYLVSGGSPTSYYLNSTTWVNDSFRKVIFLQDLSESLIVKINAFNNNNQNSIDGYIGSGQITDVFTLVGSAFTSILPVLNVMVLPGITLGILMFIPLVAMLVFAIIRIIKK